MSNSSEDIATYVLFGDEAVSIYKVSLKQLLKTHDISYTVGEYTSVKEFFREKNKWGNYTEINYLDYMVLKQHLDVIVKVGKRRKKNFSFLNIFR